MHTAMWLASAKFGARTLRELADKGLITPREQTQADAALTFLWRVRNELHFFTGHKNDVLSRELQPGIATNLGYENGDPPRLPTAHRPLPGHALAAGLGRAAGTSAGAGRRSRLLRRPPPPRRP
jgi:hypothetical protein